MLTIRQQPSLPSFLLSILENGKWPDVCFPSFLSLPQRDCHISQSQGNMLKNFNKRSTVGGDKRESLQKTTFCNCTLCFLLWNTAMMSGAAAAILWPWNRKHEVKKLTLWRWKQQRMEWYWTLDNSLTLRAATTYLFAKRVKLPWVEFSATCS